MRISTTTIDCTEPKIGFEGSVDLSGIVRQGDNSKVYTGVGVEGGVGPYSGSVTSFIKWRTKSYSRYFCGMVIHLKQVRLLKGQLKR